MDFLLGYIVNWCDINWRTKLQ